MTFPTSLYEHSGETQVTPSDVPPLPGPRPRLTGGATAEEKRRFPSSWAKARAVIFTKCACGGCEEGSLVVWQGRQRGEAERGGRAVVSYLLFASAHYCTLAGAGRSVNIINMAVISGVPLRMQP